LERNGFLKIITPQVIQGLPKRISIEIGSARFRRGGQKGLIRRREGRHVVRDFALDRVDDVMGIRIELTDRHRAVNGPKGFHDRHLRGVPDDVD